MPAYLIVPGLHGSGPDHWQTRWEADLPNCRRAELGQWDDPCPGLWSERLAETVTSAQQDVVLVAHSLGCHVVARWSAAGGPGSVVGALLVAPPDVEHATDDRIRRFAPAPRTALRFPTLLVASRNDPYCRMSRSEELARQWRSKLHDIGEAGHVNACSALGAWPEGRMLLDALSRSAVAA